MTSFGGRTPEKVKEHIQKVSWFLFDINETLESLSKAYNRCKCQCHKVSRVYHCIPCCGRSINDVINLEDNS